MAPVARQVSRGARQVIDVFALARAIGLEEVAAEALDAGTAAHRRGADYQRHMAANQVLQFSACFPTSAGTWLAGLSVRRPGCRGVGLLVPWPLKILVDSVLGSQPPPAPSRGASPGWTGRSCWLHRRRRPFRHAALGVVGRDELREHQARAAIIADFRGDLFRHTERLSVAYRDQVSTAG